MEGIITCVFAVMGWLLIVRFPDQERERPSLKFLKPEECLFIIANLERDRSDVVTEPFTMKKFLKPAADIEIWGFGFM